jgi:hypothetical protein
MMFPFLSMFGWGGINAATPRLLSFCAVCREAWLHFSDPPFMDKVCKMKITIHSGG